MLIDKTENVEGLLKYFGLDAMVKVLEKLGRMFDE